VLEYILLIISSAPLCADVGWQALRRCNVRLVKVQAPEGKGDDVAQVAFAVGISQVSLRQEQVYRDNQRKDTKDVVDVETATPTAKAFIDAVMAAPFFDPKTYSIAVRQPRSIVAREQPAKLTWPLVEPTVDLCEELWQFSHVTVGFVGRVVLAALLLAYGMIMDKLLIIIAGLLFLPFLPLLLAVGFGLWTRAWRLVGQGAFALGVGIVLTVAGGAVIALITEPPLRFNEFNPLLPSFLISLAVGIAAGLATADDAGRRELIGLAAVAQIAILPAWFGISLVFGFPAQESTSPAQRGLTFLINVGTIVCAALVIYALLGMRGDAVRRFIRGTARTEE
jgi:hypothetical protein